MKLLYFDYRMKIQYSETVSKCNFTIKCLPETNVRQRIMDRTIELFPDIPYQTDRDGLKNLQIYGTNDVPHKEFEFHISGVAETGLAAYEMAVADEGEAMIFRHPHGLNAAGEKIRQYYQSLHAEAIEDDFECALYLMHCLHRDFRYSRNVTTADTAAEAAFSLGSGVCQDLSHILIALLHLRKMTARYVTGFILGEGESHAWVEIRVGGQWIGLDPTNDVPVADDHIRIGAGRDARDCRLNRGILHMNGTQIMDVHALVKEI